MSTLLSGIVGATMAFFSALILSKTLPSKRRKT